MKYTFYLLFFLCISVISEAQTVYTNAFAGDFPTTIVLVGNTLYVGEFNTGEVSKIDIRDSNPVPVTVATGWAPGTGPWKMTYDDVNNDLYVGTFTEVRKVDLDLSLPIVSEDFSVTGISDGLTLHNNILYKATTGSLYTIDLSVGPSSYSSVYTDTTNNIGDITFYNNELYYASDSDGSGIRSSIYKLDLETSNPSQVLIATGFPGTIQKIHVVDDLLYISVEGQSNHAIAKIDLTETVFPIDFTLVIPGLAAGSLGLANQNNTFYATIGTQLIITFEDETLEVEDVLNESKINVYPNPVGDYVYLNNFPDTKNEVVVYDVNGEKVLSLSNVVSNTIDVSLLSKGLYFMNITSGSKSKIVRLVKK
ncbi:T9SS type A sorting domain-containing protein [uncultured Aquimarina sp.]|uniref:T9SS type A sorting domain-containing protein n=1 Tax=uncultured Aquimarina sp. TaxID=575652 RepID=UPI0026053082|nr:T9SS type A sorting domain-containing protein [uncultured Aquimarina sp.]